MTAEVTEIDDVPTALYRLYPQTGELLYVGITDHLKVRLAAHAKDKAWWPQVTRKTVAWYPTKPEAADAEARAIQEERPVHNIAEPARLGGPTRHGRNKHPLLGWRPPTYLSEWARAEAKRSGRQLSDLLTEALEEYRERRV